MKDRDRKRFGGSRMWFNQFFDGLRQIYQLVANLLPVELMPDGFSINIENYYFPNLKAAPSIPPYYAMLLPGRQAALQLISVIDEDLISHNKYFHPEPSMIIVAHSLPEKYAWVDEFAMKVIKSKDLEGVRKEKDTFWGKISGKYPADFFAFQVLYDRFSDTRNPLDAASYWIVSPIIANLAKGFPKPAEPAAKAQPVEAQTDQG